MPDHVRLAAFVFLSLIVMIVPTTKFAAAVAVSPALSYHTLPNGLRVVIVEDHASPVVAVNAWVHAGGKDEPEWFSGYSHYLEHLTARGTKKRKPLQDRLDIFHVGGQNSANTYFDRTQYYNVVGKEHFDLALDSLADILQNAQLPPEGIEAERKVVTEELRRFLDNPGTAAYRETFRLAFGPHPYSRPVIGNFATLNGLRRDDFMKFYKAMYAPNNVVLAIAGDVEAAVALEKVRAAFKHWKRNPALPEHPKLPTAFRGYQELTQRQPIKRAEVTLAFVVPGWRHPDRWPLDAMARVLGGNTSSRLWQAVVEREPLASQVGASAFTLEDLGLVYLSAYPKRPEDAFKLQAAILREVARLRKEGISADELARIKRQARLLQLFSGEEALSRAQELGESALYGGIRYETDWLARFEQVSAAEVADVATRYLVKENLTAVQTLPEETNAPAPGDEAAVAAAVAALAGSGNRPAWLDFSQAAFAPGEADVPTGDALLPPTPAAAAFSVAKRVLPNGLTVLFKRRPGRPVVGIALHARAGSAFDPPGREGTAQLLADMLPKGTAKLSQEEVARRFDEWGGNYSIGADRDLLYGSLTLAAEDARDGLALFSELLTAPIIDPAEFAKEKASAVSRLERRADDINAQAGDAYSAAIFAASPYRHPVVGTPEGVSAIERSDLVAFHRAAVQPGRSVLTVVGDLTEQQFERILAASRFASWQASGAPGPELSGAPPQPLLGRQGKAMDKLQSQIIVGAPAVTRLHPDYTDLRVLSSLVGFRCFVDLVYTKPMAYSTGGMASLLQGAGALSLYIGVAAEKTDEAIAELHAKWRDIREKGVPADELGHIKDRLIGGQAIADQRAVALANNLGAYEAYGLGYEYYDRQNDLIRAATAERLQGLARRYLAPEKLLTVVVGPGSAPAK
ncbi:MAG: insulinase family protein [Candidatus Sericytochromatia bacterium]|nr:insulinase family protein [Candidatus Tanganyikabacteria bacterium]